MYKVSNNIPSTILDHFFASRGTTYNLRNAVNFEMRKVCSVFNGTETLFHLGSKIWSLILQETRQSESLGNFK